MKKARLLVARRDGRWVVVNRKDEIVAYAGGGPRSEQWVRNYVAIRTPREKLSV